MNSLSKASLVSIFALSLSPAMAYSLYDGAPPIGLPVSHAVSYSAHMGWGWDNNINSSSSNEKSSLFSNFSMSASCSEVEATTTYSYNVKVGGTLYESDANNTSDRLFADCSLTTNISHQLNSKSSITSSFTLSYSPTPDYSNGISSANILGDVLNWNASVNYSYSLDNRWSLSANSSYSGNVYGDDTYTENDREYLTVGGSLNYTYSTLTSYSLNLSGQIDIHESGPDSDNIYLSGTVHTSLTPISSLSFSAGVQFKQMSGKNDLYPTLDASYRRTLPEGTSFSFYIALDNENIDTYTEGSGTYLDDSTWRAGITLSKTVTPRVTLGLDASANSSSYSDAITVAGTSLDNKTSITVNISPSISYKISENLNSTFRYNYTKANDVGGGYYRGSVSGSLTYNF